MVMFIMFLIGKVELSYGHTLELNAHSAWAWVKVGQRFVCVCVCGSGVGGSGVMESGRGCSCWIPHALRIVPPPSVHSPCWVR